MIQLGTVQRADKNLKGHGGIYKKETDERYYSFDQIESINKELAKKEMRIPTLQDLLDSGFTKKRTKNNKELANKLGLKLTGYCDSGGILIPTNTSSYFWSSSGHVSNDAWTFGCDKEKGSLNNNGRNNRFPLRPVLKYSYDTLSLGLFDNIVNRAQKYGAKLGAKAGYELGMILNVNN